MRMTFGRRALYLMLVGCVSCMGLTACTQDDEPERSSGDGFVDDRPGDGDDDDAPQEVVSALSPEQHLIRASMALRGVRPSLEDMEAVREDPSVMGDLVDLYMQTEEFGEMLRDMHNEQLQLRAFLFAFLPLGSMADVELMDFNRSVQEAPLRLIEHIIMNDRPYSEVVTADYTVADGIVSEVWGMDYDGDGEQWVETRWPEPGRTHAGILSDSYLFVRWYSGPLNAQRSRANLISRSMLCFDFLERDVDVSGNIDLSDPDVVNNAVRSPECATCHQALDPLANHFWGYEYFVLPTQMIGEYPFTTYRPDYERDHRPIFSDRTVGYFGLPTQSLRDLGQAMSVDPRFAQCAARRFYSHLSQVDQKDVPMQAVMDFQKVFEDSELNAKALIKAIVLSDAFKVSHASNERAAKELVGYKKVGPRQWSRMMEDLTGFVWRADLNFPLYEGLGSSSPYGRRLDLMKDSLFGYEVLAGGTDDFVVTRSVHTINPTSRLVFEAFAREAAGFVVERDLGEGVGPLDDALLTMVDKNTNAESDLRRQMAVLHRRFYGEFVDEDSAAVDATYGLFKLALEHGDNDIKRAWKVTLTAMLQDNRMLFY